ncbi:hypothetical protein [Succinivibrio dextrinosolvens]|uniref:hypothetical protein n=1 Tax=Succinivibrio dextrinosolvens TaxID=83771 RepID=UPI00241D4880|nr:hypothetical protein [Succinivibrio dextrinosolvens]MBE6422674.1 hypothetical protein [Succinivibrio dextrinosolvens]
MEEFGLTRVPYYPELNVVNRDNVNNDCSSLVLSVLLFWHSKDKYVRFNARCHTHLLARNLRVSPEAVKEALEYLASIKILIKEEEVITTNSEDPNKRTKLNEFYDLDFHSLHEYLKRRDIIIPVKVLRLASDDYFDFYSYISPRRLPVVQGLLGMVKGEKYDTAALNACAIICGICRESEYEDFSYKALAPGWRMLAQPPATAYDVVQRYQREGERSVDIDLMDGSFFMPDGDYFGTEKHKIWHSGKTTEPRILAAALYLCFTAVDEDVEFYSDLNMDELKAAFELLYRFTSLKGRIGDYYYHYRDVHGERLKEEQEKYKAILDSLDSLETFEF